MSNIAAYDKNSQVILDTLTIKHHSLDKTFDLVSAMDQLVIYEDLFQTAISAKLIFRDQVNLVGTMPIVGGEKVTIKYRTPIYDDLVSLDFVVYRIDDRGLSTESDNIQLNQLFLCTPEVWWAANNGISAGYKGTYTDIISKLLSEAPSKKILDKEDSVGIVEYVPPSISTFNAIKFCAGRANSKSQSPMFFWETTHGYKFKSLKELYRATQYKFIYIEDRATAGEDASPEKRFNTIYDIEYLASNNRLEQFTNTVFQVEYLVLDLNNTRILKTNNTYEDMFHKNDIKLNKFPLNDDAKSFRQRDSIMPYRKDLSHLTIFNKKSSTQLMDNVSVMVNIPGDSKLESGMVIWMDIPAKVGLSIGKEEHTSGKWFVRSIKSMIGRTTFSQTLELTKDSFDIAV
jgi:hypothetical protein